MHQTRIPDLSSTAEKKLTDLRESGEMKMTIIFYDKYYNNMLSLLTCPVGRWFLNVVLTY